MNKPINKYLASAMIAAFTTAGLADAEKTVTPSKTAKPAAVVNVAKPAPAVKVDKLASGTKTEKQVSTVKVKNFVPDQVQKALKALDMDVLDNRLIRYSTDRKHLVSCDTNAVSVVIDDGVELIHGNAFRNCRELLRIKFLGDAPNAAEEVFGDVPQGSTIYVEKGKKGWPENIPCVWKGVGLRYADEIADMPMTSDGIVTVDKVPYAIRACGDGVELAADRCGGAVLSTSVYSLPEKIGNAPVRVLGDDIFPESTNLVKVVIPASVTNFGLSAFSRCNRPKQIEVVSGNPAYRSENGVVYELESKTVIMAGTSVSSVKVPVDATAIGPFAFQGCDSLTTIEIPPTLKEIGKGAFADCVGLAVVKVPADAQIAPSAFDGGCATVKKVGTYHHCDGFAGGEPSLRWVPDDIKTFVENPLPVAMPLDKALQNAAKGDGEALCALAIRCAMGDEVKKDAALAMEYLRRAVSTKNANAEFIIGLLLESRMSGTDLNTPDAPGLLARFRLAKDTEKQSSITPFEQYVGVESSCFSEKKKKLLPVSGSLADEKDFNLVRDVYDAAFKHGCAAAGARIEHLSYLSKLECERSKKDVDQRRLDAILKNKSSH